MNTSTLRKSWLPLLLGPLLLPGCSGGHADILADDPRLADDQTPFVRHFAPGDRESVLYVWTRDAGGAGSDFIAVVDADPASPSFGRIVSTAPTGSTRNEAHHFGYAEGADRIFAGGIMSNRFFLYDIGSDARQLRLTREVDLEGTGYTGPHTAYAIPGGLLVTMMGDTGGDGAGAIVELDTEGEVRNVLPAPLHESRPVNLYDITVLPRTNRMLTTGLAHAAHFAHGPPAPEQVGNQVVVWDWQKREVTQIAEIDPGPAVLRPLRQEDATGGFVNALFGSTIWYWDEAADGTLRFERVVELPEGSIPADMRITPDDRYLFVSLWAGGKVQQYDITDPRRPRLVGETAVPQPNMMKLSPDGERLYVTNSLLSTLDGDVQFGAWLFHIGPTGLTRDPSFNPDFQNFAGGRAGPHDMLLR
jgi:methanethiol oxidase